MAYWAVTRPPIDSTSLLTSSRRSGRCFRVLRPSSVNVLNITYVAIGTPRRSKVRETITMRAAVWNGDGTLDVVERPVPDPRAGWVRIRVDAVGVCGTDLHFFHGGFAPPAGLVPGHEVSGVVDARGDGVRVPLGAPIAVEPLVGCGECAPCRRGHINRCGRRTLFGVTTRGGMADFLAVPETCVWPLPSTLDVRDGALAEPLAVCVRGLRR